MLDEGTSLLHIPVLTLVATTVRNFTPRWSSTIIHGEKEFCVYRWENHQRLICARFPFRKHAQAYAKQINAEEMIAQILSSLADEMRENIQFRQVLSSLIMDLPTCPDVDIFKTRLYPGPPVVGKE